MNIPTIPSDSGKPCDCCGRVHRKLTLLDGFWMGERCTDQYRLFLRTKGAGIAWVGWEKQRDKVARMLAGLLITA